MLHFTVSLGGLVFVLALLIFGALIGAALHHHVTRYVCHDCFWKSHPIPEPKVEDELS